MKLGFYVSKQILSSSANIDVLIIRTGILGKFLGRSVSSHVGVLGISFKIIITICLDLQFAPGRFPIAEDDG